MAGPAAPKPGVLMLGIVHHAKAEFEKLSEVADVQVRPHKFSEILLSEKFLLLTQFLNV